LKNGNDEDLRAVAATIAPDGSKNIDFRDFDTIEKCVSEFKKLQFDEPLKQRSAQFFLNSEDPAWRNLGRLLSENIELSSEVRELELRALQLAAKQD
jgi:hypothetical protein